MDEDKFTFGWKTYIGNMEHRSVHDTTDARESKEGQSHWLGDGTVDPKPVQEEKKEESTTHDTPIT
jgi:hypothetical protein